MIEKAETGKQEHIQYRNDNIMASNNNNINQNRNDDHENVLEKISGTVQKGLEKTREGIHNATAPDSVEKTKESLPKSAEEAGQKLGQGLDYMASQIKEKIGDMTETKGDKAPTDQVPVEEGNPGTGEHMSMPSKGERIPTTVK